MLLTRSLLGICVTTHTITAVHKHQCFSQWLHTFAGISGVMSWRAAPLMHEGTDFQLEDWDHFCSAYQLFISQLITVAKLQLWVIKNNFMVGVTPVWRTVLKGWSISRVENHWWRGQKSELLLIHMVHGKSSTAKNYCSKIFCALGWGNLMTAQRLLLFLNLFKQRPQKYLSICKP